MKNALKIFTALLVGAVGGSAVTWKLVDRHYQELYHRDVDDYRQRMRERMCRMQDERDEAKRKLGDILNKERNVSNEEYDEVADKGEKFSDYTKFATRREVPMKGTLNVDTDGMREEIDRVGEAVHDDGDTLEDSYEEQMAEREHPEDDESEPYVIEKSDFMNSCDWYSKYTYTYYAGNETVTDDRDYPLPSDEMTDILGTSYRQALSELGEGDEPVIYIRNPKREIDIEMVVSPGCFETETADSPGISISEG